MAGHFDTVRDGDGEFRRSISQYRTAKGTLKFPLGKPVPYELIGQAAALLAAERRRSEP